MNKKGRPNYLSNNEESLIVSAYEIEGGHGLPLDSHAISYQLQHVFKTIKWPIGDNYILKMPPLKYCRKISNVLMKGRMSMESKQKSRARG